mgnify:CR=1 FL=1
MAALTGVVTGLAVRPRQPPDARPMVASVSRDRTLRFWLLLLAIVFGSYSLQTNTIIMKPYFDEIGFACGFTRAFDSPMSIDKKARDVTKLLAKAVELAEKGLYPKLKLVAMERQVNDVRGEVNKTRERLAAAGFVLREPSLGGKHHPAARAGGRSAIVSLWRVSEISAEMFSNRNATSGIS